MARKPAADAARARFAALLAQHLKDGTRPATASGEPWTYAGFAAEVQSTREEGEFASPRSVSNWCKGKAVPAEIDPLLRALFGPSNRHVDAREALREAFKAARNEKAAAVLAKAKPSPIGEVWVKTEEGHAIDRTARPSDRRAATDPLRQQLQAIIRAHAAGLAERAKRLSNMRTWSSLATAAAAFEAVVRMAPSEMPNQLGTAYAHLLSLGRLLETDLRVQKDPACADGPLDADIHGLLTDLVRTAAPWLRGFPTVATWDDEAGRALVRPELFQPARDFVRIARAQQAISEQDAEEVERLGEAAEIESYQGSKAGNRLVGTARNLMVAEAEAVALDRITAPAVPSDARPLGVRRAQATLAAARPAWEAFSEILSPDLRQALQAMTDISLELDTSDTIIDKSVAKPFALKELEIHELEREVRAMILEGRAPPISWRPLIRSLYFYETGAEINLHLLSGFDNLSYLNLSNTNFKDITPLNELNKLQHLDLSATRVSDLHPIAGLTGLQSLNLSSTNFDNLILPNTLNALRSLDLRGASFNDISLPIKMTELHSINLSNSSISDATPLMSLGSLRDLDLSKTQISDLSPLAAMTSLRSLNLSNTQISDLSPLAALSNLRSLILAETQINDLSALVEMTSLQYLYLSSTVIIDLSPLSNLINLKSLDASRTKIYDLTPLSNLVNMNAIRLMNTKVSDVTPLSYLKNLSYLDMEGTNIADISPLSSLKKLKILDIRRTKVRDVSAISKINTRVDWDN